MLWNIYYIFNMYITKVLIWLIKLQLIWRLSWLLRFTSYMYQHFGSTYYLFFYFLSMNIGPAYNIHMLFWCQTVISFEIPEYLYALLLCLRSIIYEKKNIFELNNWKSLYNSNKIKYTTIDLFSLPLKIYTLKSNTMKWGYSTKI